MFDVVIKNANIFRKNQYIQAEIGIIGEKIAKIGKTLSGEVKINAKGTIVLPAGIDIHVHFRDWKEKEKETWVTGSMAALRGGIGVVVDQPNTLPLVDSMNRMDERIELAEKKSLVDFRINLGLTKKNFHLLKETENKMLNTAIGEVFLQHSNPNLQIDYSMLKTIREKVRDIITVHAEDPNLIQDNEGPYHIVRPPEAEIQAVKKCLHLGVFHFCHISTFNAMSTVIQSPSTFEVTPHHLFLDNKVAITPEFNVNPPLRDSTNRDKILKNFLNIPVIASDHAPHTIEEKKEGAPGFPNVELTYPLLMFMVKEKILTLKDVVDKLARNPARLFGFDDYGSIQPGKYASLAIFNFTPFEGFKAIFPEFVLIRGKMAYSDNEFFIKPGYGKEA
jgi:dihydroorotase